MPDKKKSLWAILKERLDSIGALARATKPKKRKKPAVDTGRTRRGPVRPKPSPEQEEYLRRQREEDK